MLGKSEFPLLFILEAYRRKKTFASSVVGLSSRQMREALLLRDRNFEDLFLYYVFYCWFFFLFVFITYSYCKSKCGSKKRKREKPWYLKAELAQLLMCIGALCENILALPLL